MDTSLITLLTTVCLFGIGASIDSDDLLSNVLTGIDPNSNMNNVLNQGGLVNTNGGVLPSTGNLGSLGSQYGGLGGMGGVYGSGYGGAYVDNFGYDDDHYDDKSLSSVADLVNVIFGLGGHVVGRAGWIVRDALGALTNVGSLLTHSMDMGLTGASMVRRLLSPGLFNKLAALRLARRLVSNSKIVQELKKPSGGGKVFGGNFLNKLLNKSMVTSLPARMLLGDLLPRTSRDGMLYSNHRLSDNDFGIMNRALGGLRGGGYGSGMYGPSYPSYYQRFAGRRDDD